MAIFTIIAGTAWFASLTGIAATVAAAAVTIGQTIAWSLASAALTKPSASRQKTQASITQTDEPRRRAYGRNLLGGVKVFFEAADDELYQIVVAHHGPVDGLVRFWWDGLPQTITPTGRIAKYKYAWFRDGSGAGGDYEAISPKLADYWTPDHRLEGQATFFTRFGDPSDEDFAKHFPKGAQTVVQVEVRGSRVADLNGDQIYTENAGLCLRDFFTHPDGWNMPLERLDEDIWATFTGICGGNVALANGTTEPRYSLCGYYTLEDALKDVTANMLATCDGQIYETAEGKIGILGGKWSEPEVIITGDDILSIEMADGYDPMENYNVLRGAFVSPLHAYQSVDVEERRDEAALETQEERADQFDVDMCPSGTQLQRLMKIKMFKDRREYTGVIRTNLVGLKARFPKGDGLHTIKLQAEEFGFDRIFEVTSHSFSIEGGYCDIGVSSIDAEAYQWNAATEEKPLPPNYASIATPDDPQIPPQNPALSQEYLAVSQDVQAVTLAVTVDDPGKDSLTFQAQYASSYVADVQDEDEDYDWTEMSASRLRAVTGVLDDGGTYTIRMRWKGRTDWVSAGTVTVLSNPDQPDAPTEFSGIVAGTTVALDWINAPEDFYRTQIWRGTTATFAQASLVANVSGVAGQVSDYSDVRPSGSWYYWAVTLNASAVSSDPAGPVLATV